MTIEPLRDNAAFVFSIMALGGLVLLVVILISLLRMNGDED